MMLHLPHRKFSPLLLALALSACSDAALTSESTLAAQDVALKDDALETAADGTLLLSQHWNGATRDAFHRTTEGGTIIPLVWFKALELPGSETSVLDPAFLRSMGLIPDASNPDGLPIGLAKTTSLSATGETVEFFSYTCAVCHTAEIQFKGKRLRIEGSGTLADFGGFHNAVVGAFMQTALDPVKFDRFARRVLPAVVQADPEAFAAAKAQLSAGMQPLVGYFNYLLTMIAQLNLFPVQEGAGRIDAMARVAIALFMPLDPQNAMPARAPVSMPPLWDSQKLDWRHYAGAIRQSMGRDVANAISGGAPFLPNGDSGVNVSGLHEIESSLNDLAAPLWPRSVFGQVDARLASKGEALFAAQCASCHARNEQGGEIIQTLVPLADIGTDATSAQEIHDKSMNVSALGLGQMDYFPALGALSELLKNKKYDAMQLSEQERKAFDGDRENIWRAPLAYKARPLDGVWATAPYLHNGSVASLYELLLPQAQRAAKFFVGSQQEFDPKHVGYVSDAASGAFELDTQLPGNSNAGHEYGTALSDSDRYALVEYLKTL